MSKIFLGCIADDYTGATDLASNLVRQGMRVVQTMGISDEPLDEDVDAVVVALKTRTVTAAEAVKQSLAALAWLRSTRPEQIYFKYCSTFDSTSAGNIGPVAEALMDALECDFTIACPAFPENGRTVFNGHLFVGDRLLQESGMRHHPLTPMTDSDLVRVLQAQTKRKVGLIDHTVLRLGADAITKRMAQLRNEGVSLAMVDAACEEDLMAMGPALASLALVTAGSGVAIGLPRNFGIEPRNLAGKLPSPNGYRAVVSGSCSAATNAQVDVFKATGGPAFPVDPLRLAGGEDVVGEALSWARAHLQEGPVLVYATAEPAAVKQVQAQLGVQAAGELVERTLARIARGLVSDGVGQLIVAGGETSGACTQALNITRMRIGPKAAPGVPWCYAQSSDSRYAGLHIALKSGNFGDANFFVNAFELLA
jgi:uncharacterized protein YgbK (DUF1537 family)